MPTFNTDSIDIDPEEFIDACSPSEIQELVNYLKETGLYGGTVQNHDDHDDTLWNEQVLSLIDSKWKLTTEDELTIISIIASNHLNSK